MQEISNLPFAPLFRTLSAHQIDYVLSGSVAIWLYGVRDRPPGDLDIVPACDAANLGRLVAALAELGATTTPGTGAWQQDAQGEWRWIDHELVAEAQINWRWEPDLDSWQSFDRVFDTPYGALDVVPRVAGLYADLVQRAERRTIAGLEIMLSSLDDLLARLTVPRRAKDVDRVRELRAIQQQRNNARHAQPAAPVKTLLLNPESSLS